MYDRETFTHDGHPGMNDTDPHDIGPWLQPLPLDRTPRRRVTVDDWVARIAAACMFAAALIIWIT